MSAEAFRSALGARTPARCRSCRAPIVWALTITGRRMPVDIDVAPDGNVLLGASITIDGMTGPLATVDAGPSLFDPPGLPRFRSHFATCPDAAAHRRT